MTNDQHLPRLTALEAASLSEHLAARARRLEDDHPELAAAMAQAALQLDAGIVGLLSRGFEIRQPNGQGDVTFQITPNETP